MKTAISSTQVALGTRIRRLACTTWVAAAAAISVATMGACGGDGAEVDGGLDGQTSEPADQIGSETTDAHEDEMPSSEESGGPDLGTDESPGGGECDYFAQDCGEGDKCVPWSELADLIPDESRCCPVLEPVAQAGDLCVVDDYFGSCRDNCAPGTMCLDIDDDGEGVCQELCGGTPQMPTCSNAPDDECFVYASMPLCFAKCDPLVQDCPEGRGCYPDGVAEGGTGFLCMPTIGDQMLREYCTFLSNCNPGMICATSNLLPTCFGENACCTDLCDINEEPDPCPDIHPDLECVPWYHQGAEPPSPELQGVGACVLPTVGGGV